MARKADGKLLAITSALRSQDKQGVAQSVVNRILDLVRTRLLRPGDRLPSERQLIEILDISRPTLREALRALSMLGVIESRHGGGAFVTDLEARTLLAPLDFFLSLSETNFGDAFESRRIVEIEIVRKAAKQATEADIADLNAIVAAHEKILDDPVGFRILDSRFHRKLSDAAGNVVLERIAYGLYNMGLDIRRRATESPVLIRQSTEDHIRIVQAIAGQDAEQAAVEMGIHLDHIEEFDTPDHGAGDVHVCAGQQRLTIDPSAATLPRLRSCVTPLRRFGDEPQFGAAPQRPQALENDGVAGDGQQDQEAEQGVQPELADLQPEEALLEDADHHGAEHRANHRARSAEDVDPTDDDGGDHLKLQPDAGLDRDGAEARQRHEAGEFRPARRKAGRR